MMITLMGGLAQEESVSISQNMRWANRKRMADGSYKISCPPYGFPSAMDDWKSMKQKQKLSEIFSHGT